MGRSEFVRRADPYIEDLDRLSQTQATASMNRIVNRHLARGFNDDCETLSHIEDSQTEVIQWLWRAPIQH